MDLLKYNICNGVIAFSTKRGEKSNNPYAGFNITHYCGDNDKHVAVCRTELCQQLKIDSKQLIVPRQTHSCNILEIDETFINKSDEEQTELLQGVDALITALPRICIGVSTADCVPILLYDHATKVVAAIHAGWRGTVENIAIHCISRMQKNYNCNTCNIKAIIAPSIGPDAFEVGDEVYEIFSGKGFPMNKIATRHDKWHINLWEANKQELLSCGLHKKNIDITGICTYTHYKEFFSARRLGINSGRIFNGIMIE